MQSTKFQKLAHKIAKEDKPIFDTLLDFEKSKKMESKERMNFTVDKALANKFRKYCQDQGYSMSKKVENAMRAELNNNNNKVKQSP